MDYGYCRGANLVIGITGFLCFTGLASCTFKTELGDASTMDADVDSDADSDGDIDSDRDTASESGTGIDLPIGGHGPRDSAKVYWVGHSLISAEDAHHGDDQRLTELMGLLIEQAGRSYDFFSHTIPGASLGWNYGVNLDAWRNQVESAVAPLMDIDHPEFGTFDTIVITEGVNIEATYNAWDSGFFARKWMCTAFHANPDTEFFIFESWHHLQKGDAEFSDYYDAYDPWDFVQYQKDARSVWDKIADEASDPRLTPETSGYYQWHADYPDPGDCDLVLDVRIVPTGQALVNLLERLEEQRESDDWTYTLDGDGDALMSDLDLFANPYLFWPDGAFVPVHFSDFDDIHPSHLLVYFNALVHYATLYRRNPSELPAGNGVPKNLATIMKQVAWETVLRDPRTGVLGQ